MGKAEEIDKLIKIPGLKKNAVWRFFSSIRLALILMFLLTGLSLIGTFIVQIPAEYTTNPLDYNGWLENVAQPQTGVWYPLLHLLGLFNVFHSIWFLGAGALLVISIIICSVNRWSAVRSRISPLYPIKEEEYYRTGKYSDSISLKNNAEYAATLVGLFKKQHLKVNIETSSDKMYITGDKNRFSPLGTYLIHVGLVLFIVGYLLGSYLGFNNPSFVVTEGYTKEVGSGTNLTLRLVSFSDEYWPNGSPKDYRSQVILYENNLEVSQATVQVNHPLIYKGIRFYQSFFGSAAAIQVKDAQGNNIFNNSIAFCDVANDEPYRRPVGFSGPIANKYLIYIMGRADNLPDADLKENQIALEIYQRGSADPLMSTKLDLGLPHQENNWEITYLKSLRFSGFQVSRDPGNSLIWIASGLFLLGLLVVFYFPRRQVWAMFSGGSKMQNLYIRTSFRSSMLKDFRTALSPKTSNKSTEESDKEIRQ